jgi:hypothetical protein
MATPDARLFRVFTSSDLISKERGIGALRVRLDTGAEFADLSPLVLRTASCPVSITGPMAVRSTQFGAEETVHSCQSPWVDLACYSSVAGAGRRRCCLTSLARCFSARRRASAAADGRVGIRRLGTCKARCSKSVKRSTTSARLRC